MVEIPLRHGVAPQSKAQHRPPAHQEQVQVVGDLVCPVEHEGLGSPPPPGAAQQQDGAGQEDQGQDGGGVEDPDVPFDQGAFQLPELVLDGIAFVYAVFQRVLEGLPILVENAFVAGNLGQHRVVVTEKDGKVLLLVIFPVVVVDPGGGDGVHMAEKILMGNMLQAIRSRGAEQDLPGGIVPDDITEVGLGRAEGVQPLLVILILQIAQGLAPAHGVIVVQYLRQVAVPGVHGLVPGQGVGVVAALKKAVPV